MDIKPSMILITTESCHFPEAATMPITTPKKEASKAQLAPTRTEILAP